MALDPLDPCSCEKGLKVIARDERSKIMQFLMGLNDSYDQVRNQILLLEPLPSVNKTFNMVLKVERQRYVHNSTVEKFDSSAMNVRNSGTNFYSRGGRGNIYRGGKNPNAFQGRGRGVVRKTKEEKEMLYCDHCQVNGHERSFCFKLHGYPEWFLKLREDKKRSYANQAGVAQNESTSV